MRFSLKQRKIQNIIEKQFPVSKKLSLINVTLAEPKIILIDGSERLGIIFKTTLRIANKWQHDHDIYVDGEIEYQKHVGELYLKNAEVNFLVQSSVAKIGTWPINKITARYINKYMQRTPIYHFNQDDFIHKLAKSRIKDLKIENRSLVFEFKFF